MIGGFNWSNISHLEGSKAVRGFHLGFYFDIKLQEKLFLHTGVIVKSPMGAKGLAPYPLNDDDLDSILSTASVSKKLRYFNVPVLIKYKFCDEFEVEEFEKDDLILKTISGTNTSDLMQALRVVWGTIS